jgi:hypothetical protein
MFIALHLVGRPSHQQLPCGNAVRNGADKNACKNGPRRLGVWCFKPENQIATVLLKSRQSRATRQNGGAHWTRL